MEHHHDLISIKNIPTLGQNLDVGSLYDIRTNSTIISGNSSKKANVFHKTELIKSTHFRVSISDTFKQRSSLMDVSTEILLCLLSPPITLVGSAKYLESRNSNTKSTSVTLRLTKLDSSKRLENISMGKFSSNAKETSEATHVISEISYGSDSYFVFEQKVEEDQNEEDVRDCLSVIVECAIERVSGKFSSGSRINQTNAYDKIRCKFYGDFEVARSPNTFAEAFELIRNILSGSVKRISRPISFCIEPLKLSLEASGKSLVCSISETIILRVCRLRNYQERCLQELDDLIGSSIFSDNSFDRVRKFIEEVKRIFSDNNLKFNERICHLLKRIKSGEAEESEMMYLITMFENSRFGKEKYKMWYDDMKLEVQFVEQILMKIQTNKDNISNIHISKNNIQQESIARTAQSTNGGRYELNIKLQSFMDIKLLEHLEDEFMVSRQGRNLDEYPMNPGFLNGDDSKDTKFITYLSQKIDAFKALSQFEKNLENSELIFDAIITYPSESKNTISINFDGNRRLNNDIDLDFQLKMKQVRSREDRASEFCFQICPRNAIYSSDEAKQKEIHKFPDMEIDLWSECFDKVTTTCNKGTGSITQGHDSTNISVCSPSSTTPYILRGMIKFIGGAQYPQVLENLFYSIQFCNLRYDSNKHQLKVDVVTDHSVYMEAQLNQAETACIFDIEFRYRNVEDERKNSTKTLKGYLESENHFYCQLEDEDKGYFECQCRYVIKNDYSCMMGPDSKYYSLIDGGKEGGWSLVQYVVIKS